MSEIARQWQQATASGLGLDQEEAASAVAQYCLDSFQLASNPVMAEY